MSDSLAPVSSNVPEPVSARRAEIEQELFHAIERARRQYISVDARPETPQPTVNPPHLGLRIDVRA